MQEVTLGINIFYFLGIKSFIAKHKLQTEPDTSIDAHIIYTIFSERRIINYKNVIRKKILPDNIFEDYRQISLIITTYTPIN